MAKMQRRTRATTREWGGTTQRTVWLLLILLGLTLAGRQLAQAAVTPIAEIVSAVKEKRFDDALHLCREALKTTPADTRLWTLEGMAYAGLGQQQAALTAYQHALKVAPHYLPAIEGSAQTAFQLGDASAKSLLLKVLEQQPEDATSHAMLGSLAYRANHCDEAIEHFQKAAAALASEPNALAEYGSCLGSAERFEEAARIFTQLVAIDNTRWQARYDLALLQWKAKQGDQAIETLAPLLDATPAEEDALTLGAEIAEERGETQRAINLLRKAIVEHPTTVDAYLQFAYLSGNHASFKVGIDMLSAGLTQMPQEPRLYLARGVLYGQMEDSDKSMSDLERANQLDPQLSFAGAAKGVLQSQQHKTDAALATFRAAAKAQPNNAFAQYLLAEALSEQNKEPGSEAYREEVAAANRAVRLDPTMAAAMDLLASLYLEDGLTAKSIEQSEAALKQDPDDEQAVYHLILALRKTDRKNEVPALVKKLAALHKTKTSATNRYQIYEVSPPAPE